MRKRTSNTSAAAGRASFGGRFGSLAQPGNLPRFALDHPGGAALVSVCFLFILLLLLRQISGWDVALTEMFSDSSICPENPEWNCTPFPWRLDGLALSVREAGIALPYALVFVFLALLIWRLRRKARGSEFFVPLLGLSSALLGPVLVTNVLLKGNWGRPRPEDTVQFGGEWDFVLPGTWSSQCADNCSFPSGEATFAYWGLMGLALLPRRWHLSAAVVIIIFASTISMLRVTFGKHYFSDVVMGGAVAVTCILAINWALHRWQLHERLAAWNARA
ncbi:phosphatase PAP2 family protein [Ahrensia sp. R2A130]|uniref:phosphatase PAP2 family protein n=1 Tax=Ahrensia sp. R2A130 TaxID=744979 RepID=UPI0001E0A479|nr:phosphatase PAP2 family protein [Ahrensia sp. R2A130]EFL89667.1 superfamily protein [Ahrensia sp. R2A130]